MLVTHNSEQHTRVIELLAWWEGKVNSTQLSQYFNVSTKQAKKYLQQYQNTFPFNLGYNASIKGFQATSKFIPQYIDLDVNQYLDWLAFVQPSASHNNNVMTYTRLSVPKRQVLATVMRGLVQGIKQQRCVEVQYVSFKNPQAELRVIEPHCFVKTGLRWHLRAYDQGSHQFKDFVLSRFRGMADVGEKAPSSSTLDTAWHTFITLIFAPAPNLEPAQKSIIEQDYQMQNGCFEVNCRAALAQYLIQEMQVNIKFHDSNASAQQIVLVNKSDLSDWLFAE